jgi:transcriptional regulator with XRE-family HTH domain
VPQIYQLACQILNLRGELAVTLGNAIKLIRTARRVKQVELAEKLKVSANYISLIEKDKREPSVAFLRNLSSRLEVPVSLFFMYQEIGSAATVAPEVLELSSLVAQLQGAVQPDESKKRRKRSVA